MKHIYTIGNCSKISHKEASRWRDEIRLYFENWADNSVKVINITDYYSYDEKFHDTDKEIANFCERSIKKSDCVIVNYDELNTSSGSQREIGLARAYGIPIFIVNKDGELELYPWDLYWCERVFEDLNECCRHINEYIINA